jgi:hypothetical protein
VIPEVIEFAVTLFRASSKAAVLVFITRASMRVVAPTRTPVRAVWHTVMRTFIFTVGIAMEVFVAVIIIIYCCHCCHLRLSYIAVYRFYVRKYKLTQFKIKNFKNTRSIITKPAPQHYICFF